MASNNIYPPIVESSLPAFLSSNDVLHFPFMMSKVSLNVESIKSVHISVVKQSTGQSVVNANDSGNRFRASGMIVLNQTFKMNEDNIYSVDIKNEDIMGGWEAGCIYKIQLRLSTVAYTLDSGADYQKRVSYFIENASNFSEWTSFCVIKAIGKPSITFPVFNNQSEKDLITDVPIEIIDFKGYYENETDKSEIIFSYDIELYDSEHFEPIDKSGIIYSSKVQSINQFLYTFKSEFKSLAKYKIKFHYVTINKYEETIEYNFQMEKMSFGDIFVVPIIQENLNKIRAKIDEHSPDEENAKKFIERFEEFSPSIAQEEEEGRICVKLWYDGDEPNEDYGNYLLRRSDSKDNFLTWRDIKRISFPLNDPINSSKQIFYDYTIESGVFYRYAVQKLDKNGRRISSQGKETEPIIREFEYAYLLGENEKQLKLNLSNTVNSYTYSKSDTKTDTIGGQYPFISRNGAMNYRTFPLGGMVSFCMDDRHSFTSDKELYGESKKLYDVYRRNKFFNGNKNIDIENSSFGLYDYKREFDFREKVLDFLQDGKPKLFKSATEGNIIVRLTNVSFTHNQSLDRMIGTFSATAYEIAPINMDNYEMFKLFNLGDYLSDFSYSERSKGHLDLELSPGENIMNYILGLEGTKEREKVKINNVSNLSIQFLSKPLPIQNTGNKLLGNNLSLNEDTITVLANGTRKYVFDKQVLLDPHKDILKVEGASPEYEETEKIKVSIDFTYEKTAEELIRKKNTVSLYEKQYIGQVYKTCEANEDIYEYIKTKYNVSNEQGYSSLHHLENVTIEANPDTVFFIRDMNDKQGQYHVINDTCLLSVEIEDVLIQEIRYVGVLSDNNSVKQQDTDIIVNFVRVMTEGKYGTEG